MNDAWLVGLAAFAGGLALGVWVCRRRESGRARAAAPVAPPPSSVEPGESLAAFGAVLGEAVFALDASDRLVFANEIAARRLGLDSASLGRDAAVLLRSADFLARLRAIRERPDVDTEESEVVLRRGPRERERVFGMRVAPLPVAAGYGQGCLLILLADKTRLRHLERLRREFVANVSHDLRTPVTILKGYSRTLEEDFPVMDDGDRRRFLEKIRRNVDRLHGLLESMVELAAADDGGALALRPAAMNAVLRDVADMMADRLAAQGVSIEVLCAADDSLVEIDPMRFSRILINLLENVLRYAAGATRVCLSTACDADGFHLRVEDDGPGLASSAEYDRVFDRFFRAEKSRSLDHGGSGLGLAIVKNMVLSHGGSVRAQPASPHGFAVVISLPLSPSPGAQG